MLKAQLANGQTVPVNLADADQARRLLSEARALVILNDGHQTVIPCTQFEISARELARGKGGIIVTILAGRVRVDVTSFNSQAASRVEIKDAD